MNNLSSFRKTPTSEDGVRNAAVGPFQTPLNEDKALADVTDF